MIQYNLLTNGDCLLVAVSGGPDSMALLHLLKTVQSKWNLKLMAVHLNHQFRGEEADQDQLYVEAMCKDWNITCITKKMDVALYAKENKLSKQVAARECRYQFFEELAKEYNYYKVAVAHHADDQLETVMMRFIRGAGLQGLSGMPMQRETDNYTIIRPLLTVTKEQIEAYCKDHHIQPRLDRSNESDDYTRNYIRHHLVPPIVQLNPNIHQIVTEMTETFRLENEYIEEQSKRYAQQVIRSKTEDSITIDLSSFLEVPLPLQRRLILLLLSYLPISRTSWSKIHIDYILSVTTQKKGQKRIHLPDNILLWKEYDQIMITNRQIEREEKVTTGYVQNLPMEGECFLTKPHIKVKITKLANQRFSSPQKMHVHKAEYKQPLRATFDADLLCFPLQIRNRLPGDKIQPLGMDGHKKVKDIFIDEKIPVSLRHEWPILTDQESIIWIPGLKRTERAKVTENTKNVVTIEIEEFEEDTSSAR